MTQYHVALSFAGEDREYVEKVAAQLRLDGVNVFYDMYEEVDLWGKDLYEHLSNVYQNMAMFTVMFVSAPYRDKVWTNHERRSAQARAFTESKEYILPAIFDDTVEIPALLKTTGRISLKNKTPEKLAQLIAQKLERSGVNLHQLQSYSDVAKADVDFPIEKASEVGKIIKALKSYNWPTQNPAVVKLLALDWSTISSDEAFVLGRNLYQCACGTERRAEAALANLRRELASLPEDRAIDFLNGMLFEVYFNSSGEFRGRKLKSHYLEKLLNLQTVKKYSPSISFIRRAIEPYKSNLPFLPNVSPEKVVAKASVKRSDPPIIRSLMIGDKELLTDAPDSEDMTTRLWRLSHRSFTLDDLSQEMSNEWGIPLTQLKIVCRRSIDSGTKLRLSDGYSIIWPIS
ncbi:MAG: toll/interleukin-1 receptor domain-containing protein [Desulfobulbia bacterium]